MSSVEKIARIASSAALLFPAVALPQNLNVPAVVITVQQMIGIGNGNSSASFSIYNGGNAVAANSAGVIDVYRSTNIRFILQSAGSDEYVPVGISFQQVGSGPADPEGKRNFPSRIISEGVLTVQAGDIDADTFEYSIVYKRTSDGALGLIDPHVVNHPNN